MRFPLTDKFFKKKDVNTSHEYLIFYPPTLLFSNYQRPQHILNFLSKKENICCLFCDWTVKDLKVNNRFYVSKYAFSERYIKKKFQNFHNMKKVYYFSVPEKVKLLDREYAHLHFDTIFFELMDMPLNQFLSWQEDLDAALEKAHIISTTNVFITQYLQERTKKKIITSKNGVDMALFQLSSPGKRVLRNSGQSVAVGFYGNLENWIDWDLIYNISQCPDVHVYVIGRNESNEHNIPDSILCCDHISVIDYKPVTELVYYLNEFDICLYPFKICEMTDAVDPLKLWEYLCFGKPVISSQTRYVSYLMNSDAIIKNSIYTVNESTVESDMIHSILKKEKESPRLKQERINYVHRNRRWEVICDALYSRIVS